MDSRVGAQRMRGARALSVALLGVVGRRRWRRKLEVVRRRRRGGVVRRVRVRLSVAEDAGRSGGLVRRARRLQRWGRGTEVLVVERWGVAGRWRVTVEHVAEVHGLFVCLEGV